jgi:protein O-GlcNAc transferase
MTMSSKNLLKSEIQSLVQMAMQKQQSGQLNEAEMIYKSVLYQSAHQVGQYCLGNLYKLVIHSLGDVLRKQGKLKEALEHYQKVIMLEPNFAEAYNNIGTVFFKQGRLKEAIEYYQKAISIKPDLAYSHNNLGNALKTKDLEAAIQSYQQAIDIRPDFADAHYNLGNALKKQGQLEASIASYQQALNIQPDFAAARFGICISQLPIVYSHVDEIRLRRNQYQQHLQDLADYYHCAKLEQQAEAANMVGCLQPFYLPYQGLNDRALQKIYGGIICQLMAKRYPQWSKSIPTPQLGVNEKIRVGFISGFFRTHATWRIPTKGWVENLDKSEFELFGYHTNIQQDEETVRAAKGFDKFTQGPFQLEQWADMIQGDRLHVLIYPEFGMDPMSIKLGCLRLAPIQITTWGHPNTSGMPTIDYFLSSELMESENAQDYYTEHLVKLPNLSCHYTPLEIQSQPITKRDIGIADDEIMFWCCQSLYKYLPQNDDVFPRIAQKLTKKCKFVFFKNSDSEQVTEIFCKRLKQIFKGFGLNYQDYCIFLPPVTIKTCAGIEIRTFKAMAAIADIFLDSIGWSGCNTTIEAIADHIPIVTLPGELMRGRHSMAILKMMGIEETIASSKEDYVQIAVRLGEDAQYRLQISQKVAEKQSKLYGDLKPVRALEEFLLKLLNKPRRFSAKEVAEALQLAIEHQRNQRFADAEQLYHQVLEKESNHPEALFGLGILAQHMGQPQTAEHWLSAALQVQPDSVKIWFNLGNVRQAQAQWSKAQEAYQQAIALRPDAAPIYNNLGYTLQQQGLFDEAIACYQKALEVQPNCIEADVNWGNALQAQGKLSPEKQLYYAQLNYNLGVQRKNAGDIKMAIAYYKQAIVIQPDLVEAYNDLHVLLQEQG